MLVGAIFFPLLGATIAGFFGRWIGDRAAQLATVLCMVLAALCGAYAFAHVAFLHQSQTVAALHLAERGRPAIQLGAAL